VKLEPAPLEDWLRERYFDASTDISSSGVEPYTLGEIQALLGIASAEFAAVSFRDSRSAGADDLRALIAARSGVHDSSRVLVANGSTEAQFLVLAATLAPGDEVVVVEPAYHTLVAIARGLDCRLVRWPLRPEQGFRPDLDNLRALVSARTKMIIVNFPHNPTGVTLSLDEQRKLIELAGRHGCYLFWDGAFEDLALDAPALPAVSCLYERGLSFGTLSKSFGLPGLRVGWAIVPPDVVQGAVSVRDYTTLALSPIVEFIASRALSDPDRLISPRIEAARTNRELFQSWLAAHRGLVSCPCPTAGVVAFPRLRRVADTVSFCHRLMQQHRVLVVPGECFGIPGHLRLGFGGNEADLRRGLGALSAHLKEECGS
jgi:capreomycidine synthase